MKRVLLALALLAALVANAAASEFTNGFKVGARSHSATLVGGWYSVDSTGRYLLFDVNGNLRMIEASKDRDMQLIQPSFFTTRFVYGADGISSGWTSPRAVTADSTALLAATQGYNRLGMFVTVSFEDSVGAALFALQYRGAGANGATDSTNTFIDVAQQHNSYFSASNKDTIGTMVNANPSGIGLWGGALGDTSALYEGEIPWVVSRTLNGSGRFIRVVGSDGRPFCPPYFGFRLRLMNTYYQGTGGGGLVPFGSGGMD